MKQKRRFSFQKLKDTLKSINSIIQIISAYTIFSGIILFLIGFFSHTNIVNDDFILNDIKKQIPNNSTISNIYFEDLHGFGNNSIIVLINNEDSNFSVETATSNELLIFDSIDNDFLKYIYRPFNIGSSYILKYKCSLDDVENGCFSNFAPQLDILDLTDDGVKDIVAYWASIGASDGVLQPCIISWHNGTYNIIGSFPAGYDEYLETAKPLDISETIKKKYTGILARNFYKPEQSVETFGIVYSFWYEFYDFDFDENKELIIYAWQWAEDEARVSQHFYRMDVYKPIYYEENRLDWELLYSTASNKKIKVDNIKQIRDILMNNYNEDIENNNI